MNEPYSRRLCNTTSYLERPLTKCIPLAKTQLHSMLGELATILPQREGVVLMYHSVDWNNAFWTVSPRAFKRQIDYLRINYSIISLDDILDFVQNRSDLPEKSVAITFDDGYHDNYLNAYPYLKRFDLPAAIFLSTGYCGKYCRVLDSRFRLKMLEWDEIVEMSENGITIGAHTVDHLDLTSVDHEVAKQQMLRSRNEIQERIRQQVNYFAYPYGRHDEEIARSVGTLGFRAAFGGNRGLIRRGDDRLALNRISVDAATSFSVFKARVTRAVEWYTMLERHIKKLISRMPIADTVNRFYHDTDLAPRVVE